MNAKQVCHWLAWLLCALVLTGCGERKDDNGSQQSTVARAVEFLAFPNPHPNLGVADYDIIITNNSGSTFSYTLTIEPTDSGSQRHTGTLANGASTTITYAQLVPGGVTIRLDSGGGSASLALRVSGTSTNIASASAANPTITLEKYQTDTVAYATAYYAAIDPNNDRDTLAKFKSYNGFGSECAPNGTSEFEVRFRDVLDLGYGRHMCVRGSTSAVGDVVAWVENFQVTAVPGLKYGPLNLEALINNDRRWHVGTNAIEYSAANPNLAVSSTNPRITKFYTFNPDGTRRLLVDLDGRGAKAMPVPCISCHGGQALPLTAAGFFPLIRSGSPRGETYARMQPINVDTLDFSTAYPFRRTDQEASLKNINRLVLCTYPLVGAAGAGGEDDCRLAVVNNQWQGTAASMVKSWYGGTGANGLPNTTQSDTFVPTAWTDASSGVSGSTNLYQTVVAPNCRVCHLLRGNANSPGASDIDFTTYTKFAGTNASTGFNSRIKHHVFDRGNMPLALLKWEHFWESRAPETLSSFITNSTSGGSYLQPTRPVAKPGPDRVVRTSAAIKLSGAESVNAISYRWTVASHPGTAPTLTNENTIRPTFTANANGTHTLELVVNDGSRNSDPATLTIVANSSVTNPSTLRFSDIKTILQDTTTLFCTSCHTPSDPSGPPVYYTDYDRDGDGDTDTDDTHQFYLDVRARINFTDIESSRLLMRPAGLHHPGGLLTGFDTSYTPGNSNRSNYDTFLNWILNGAPE